MISISEIASRELQGVLEAETYRGKSLFVIFMGYG